MQKRILWAVGLFTAATAMTAAMGKWTRVPLDGTTMALVVMAVGALLIGLGAGQTREAESGARDEPIAEPPPVEEEM